MEIEKGVLDVDPSKPTSIAGFAPGYIDKEKELIVGLQTDAPLKRAIKPLGGIGMVKAALEAYGFTPDKEVGSKHSFKWFVPAAVSAQVVIMCMQSRGWDGEGSCTVATHCHKCYLHDASYGLEHMPLHHVKDVAPCCLAAAGGEHLHLHPQDTQRWCV